MTASPPESSDSSSGPTGSHPVQPGTPPPPPGYGQPYPGQGYQPQYGAGAPQGQDPYAQQPYAPDPYAQPPQAQNPYTQNPNAQNPYAQNPYAQNPYAQNPYGQNAYGQPGQYPPPGYPQQPSGQPPVPGQEAPLSPSDERLWSTLSHISVPFLLFVGPLVAYLLFKDRGPFVRANATESLNFSILYTVAVFVCSLLTAVSIGGILLSIVFIGVVILAILAAVAANKGELYKYPVNWRLIK